jgi:hypothetical protein
MDSEKRIEEIDQQVSAPMMRGYLFNFLYQFDHADLEGILGVLDSCQIDPTASKNPKRKPGDEQSDWIGERAKRPDLDLAIDELEPDEEPTTIHSNPYLR